MQEVYKQIALAAGSDASVLLSGESGTGKELAARAIHRYSARAGGPFVAVNVASLSSTLAESELFGHVRGAFTGAEAHRDGLLAQANGGTLFLDEVADIPQPTQVKLLRALEHGEVIPVGGNEPVRSDFRVISATHRDLARRVGRRLVSARSVLPACARFQSICRRCASGRRTSPSWPSISRHARQAAGHAQGGDLRRSARRAGTPAMARQRPRAAQCDRPCADRGPRPGDHAGASAAGRRRSSGPTTGRRRCRGRRRRGRRSVDRAAHRRRGTGRPRCTSGCWKSSSRRYWTWRCNITTASAPRPPGSSASIARRCAKNSTSRNRRDDGSARTLIDADDSPSNQLLDRLSRQRCGPPSETLRPSSRSGSPPRRAASISSASTSTTTTASCCRWRSTATA